MPLLLGLTVSCMRSACIEYTVERKGKTTAVRPFLRIGSTAKQAGLHKSKFLKQNIQQSEEENV